MAKKRALRVGIVGAGLIGLKRAHVVQRAHDKLVAVADTDRARAEALAGKFDAEVHTNWKELVARPDLDVVIVAVPNAFAKPVVLAALRNGKHVLCEKPFGISSGESAAMLAAAKKVGRLVKVGFNHRFHASIQRAREIVESGGIGWRILFIRARYGHGGRPGMEKEWRFKKRISGGGELLDQGVHVIDLARWFGGEFASAYGLARTKFWKASVDDNTFALLENSTTTVSFHVSTTQWKNIFSFEVFGDKGYVQLEGRGGGYGEETLTWGKRVPGAAPDMQVFKFGPEDISWGEEWKNFNRAIAGKAKMIGDGRDGLMANRIVEALYESSRRKRPVRLT